MYGFMIALFWECVYFFKIEFINHTCSCRFWSFHQKKKRDKEQKMVDKTLNRKIKIEQHELH